MWLVCAAGKNRRGRTGLLLVKVFSSSISTFLVLVIAEGSAALPV